MSESLDLRIKLAVKRAGGAPAVAESTGFGVSSVYNYMKLKPAPPLDFMYGLCAAANVRPEWLFMNEMPVGVGDESGDWETGVSDLSVGEKKVPIRDVAASAGHGLEPFEEDPSYWLTFPLVYLMNLGNPDTLEIIKVAGDSMAPELFDGDMAMIDQSRRSVADGLYVLLIDDRLFLKRVVVKGRNRLELVSTNPVYPSFEVTVPDEEDDFSQDGAYIVGKVVWVGRAL